jgi:tetratricopeptide (TPR) repeat protein
VQRPDLTTVELPWQLVIGGVDPMAISPTIIGYTTREVASLLGVSEARVRYFVRSGLLKPGRGRRHEYRFSFHDVVLLRAAKGLLDAGIPARRVRRSLAKLPSQLPRGRSLTAVRIQAEGNSVVVREGDRRWIPESGQLLLDLDVGELAQAAAPLAPRLLKEAEDQEPLEAEEWFEIGCELEALSAGEAIRAYERVLASAPDHADAHLNLGRMLHEVGCLDEAKMHYLTVLARHPVHAIASYNLGVAFEDEERYEEAAQAYELAVHADPTHADAYFNLAGVCERLGRGQDAFRFLKEYRSLTRVD